jgi:colanic acid/amylovoran biosynthesis glycosyltransferase
MPPGDERPVAAIVRSALFNASETFVRDHAAGLRRYRSLLVGLEGRANAPPAILPRGPAGALRARLLGLGSFAPRLRPHRPVLVHAHFGPDGLLALPLAERLGVPLVTTLHGYDVSRSDRSLFLSGRLSWIRYVLMRRRLMEGGRLFLAVSDAVRQRAVARGYPAERTLTHHNGVDLRRFRAGAATPGLILHVGRLVEKKGTKLLLDAFAEAKRTWPGASLAILGDGPLRPVLERRAAALALGDSVRFLGALSHEETAAWMSRAWLLAVPSLAAPDGDSEGLPQVVLEAAASSLPVVGSGHAGIPEAVEDGRSGFIVPEGDAGTLARRLAELLASPELRRCMGASARTVAETRFDSRRQIDRLETLYDSLRQMPS